ncbi:MAG TPA: NAD(P)-binding protein, partial [Thermoguttaceae bacterium]|nr:NAD(P)-binding protein [Thermoguttaceae bacterium]
MTDPHCPSRGPSVAVVGGGLAGMAAAVAAAEGGLRVELFEQTKSLGGRAGSFRDGRTGLTVDFCQHVSMGCCTMLADFCRRIDAADCFRRDRRLHFFSPEGKQHDFAAAAWLPAPWHLLPGILRLKYLTLGERWGILRALRRLTRDAAGGRPAETVGAWLRRHGQSQRAIERFWSVVLVSALSETIDRASLSAARKVFLDGFLASRRAYELAVPTVPLGEIFDWRVRT